jgi:hypothetical protein
MNIYILATNIMDYDHEDYDDHDRTPSPVTVLRYSILYVS